MPNQTDKNLEEIRRLLAHNLAVMLYVNGCNKHEVARHLRIAKGTAADMLKGIKRALPEE